MITFTNALELLRNIRTTAQNVDDGSIAQGLLDLQGQLLSLQILALEQQVENRAMLNETIRLQSCLATARKLERVNDSYFLVQNEADIRGPYCVVCWDRRDVLQALVEAGDSAGYCPNCKTKVKTGKPNRFAVPLHLAVNE